MRAHGAAGPLIAVVTGASRGAGRGIARALSDAGATVYCAGRSARGGWAPADGAPGTVDDTAEEVTARGGRGIAVPTDCTDAAQVAALFARVADETEGRLDVLANAVWGGHDKPDGLADWGKPFWELDSTTWDHHMDAGPRAYFLAAREAMRLMAPRRRGVIVGLTDGFLDGTPEAVLDGREAGAYSGALLWDLGHVTINRLMATMAADVRKAKVAVITLMPGFMRTERVERSMTSDDLKRQFRYDLSESTAYVGRAVVALARDRGALAKSGRIHFVADLAKEYGFTDEDGRVIPRFAP